MNREWNSQQMLVKQVYLSFLVRKELSVTALYKLGGQLTTRVIKELEDCLKLERRK